jgi:hypothetical protein
MPEDTHAAGGPAPEIEEIHERQTDRAPPWDCDAPTKSERGSRQLLTTLQGMDTTEDAGHRRSERR